MNTLIILVLTSKDKNSFQLSQDEAELEGLCKTAGLKVCEVKKIKLKAVTPSYYIGQGKAQELSREISLNKIKAVLFRESLSALQQRNLSELLKAEVIDKNYLILKIFEQRANSPEGKLQVRLAKAAYEMTRLYGRGSSLDQQEGAIGTRGAGEKLAEYKRRELKDKFVALKRELEKIKKERLVQRSKRRAVPLPQISITGYTNCGKSTLLSILTQEKHNIYADDRLFATLDTLTKRVKMPAGYSMLFSDTVGFISGLPAFLVEAFKSTLEEIKYCDLLIHLKDLSNPDWQEQSECVKNLLKEIGAGDMPVIEVFNKTDRVSPSLVHSLKQNPLYKNHLFICAKNKEGLKELLEKIQDHFSKTWSKETLRLKHEKAALVLGEIENYALIEKRTWLKDEVVLVILASQGNLERIKKLLERF